MHRFVSADQAPECITAVWPALPPSSSTTELSDDTLWDIQAEGNGKPHQGMERTACETAENRAGVWELKTERIETHLCQTTGERTGHKSQRKQSLWTGTQPEASVCSQQRTLKATKSRFTPLPNLSPPHTPASTAAPATETPVRFLSPSPANDPQGRNRDPGTSVTFVTRSCNPKFSLLPVKYPTIQNWLGKELTLTVAIREQQMNLTLCLVRAVIWKWSLLYLCPDTQNTHTVRCLKHLKTLPVHLTQTSSPGD